MIIESVLIIFLTALFVFIIGSIVYYSQSKLNLIIRILFYVILYFVLIYLTFEYTNSMFIYTLILILFILIVAIYVSLSRLKTRFICNQIVLKYFFERYILAITDTQKINKIRALNKIKEDGLECKSGSKKYAKEQISIAAKKLMEEVKKDLVDYTQEEWVVISLTNPIDYGLSGGSRLTVKDVSGSQDIASIEVITQYLSPSRCKNIIFTLYPRAKVYPYIDQSKNMELISRKMKKKVYKYFKHKHSL